MPERRYDEKQVGAILQRAGEIKGDFAPAIDANGITLDELKRVAAEVGIEPEIVDRAANEVNIKPNIEAKQTDALMLDQTVDGVLSEEAWEDATMGLRQIVGRPGNVSVHGSTREWSAGLDLGNISLFATTKEGRTRLRMLADTTGLSALAWVIGGTVGLLGSLLTGILLRKNAGLENWSSFLIAIAVLIFVCGLVQTLTVRSRKKFRNTLEEQFAQIVAKMQPERAHLQATGLDSQVEAESLFTESEGNLRA
jgi:hypothetical protein